MYLIGDNIILSKRNINLNEGLQNVKYQKGFPAYCRTAASCYC